jgi:hypothetical protein
MGESNPWDNKKIDFIKHIYEWNQNVTHFADTKVSALQIINTLIISFSATFSTRQLPACTRVVIVSAIVLAAVSSLMLLLTLFPRMSKRSSAGVNFYGGILKYNRKDYHSKMAEIGLDELLDNYVDSIYAIALIQEKKFFRLRAGLLLSFIAITLVGLAIVLNILYYPK